MDTLFDDAGHAAQAAVAPLAARMRPRSLEEFVGQRHLLGPGMWLRRAIERDELSSVILFGPPGTGKTSLARIIAARTGAHFEEVSAVTSGVTELRRAIEAAAQRLALSSQRTIVFVDEIHRFNRAQQDVLLHAIEDGVIVLIGATTENPYFEVNSPLLSRARVAVFEPLADDEVGELVRRACADERGFGGSVEVSDEALEAIVARVGGDGRVALSMLEAAAATATPDEAGVRRITVQVLDSSASARVAPHDKAGDLHYDIISAFIKSMRGSDPDAALYWLARLIHGGEDPRFIARRMLIFASEDVGLADPTALLVAEAAFRSAEVIGLPECRINLAHAAVHLALAPKSNSCYLGIDRALEEVERGPVRHVPDHLRDRHRPGAERYGRYLYPHAYPDARVKQRYLPEGLDGATFFVPTPRDRIPAWWRQAGDASKPSPDTD